MRKVVILATGGTIAGRGEAGHATNYASGSIRIEELLASVPGISELAELEWVQAANLNSDDITAAHWVQLGRVIEERSKEPEVAGFVVTHGTDTLEETAYFLHLTLKTDKPVVVTGSMRPATALSADGPGNLYAAVALAADAQAAGRGVLVVFANRIYGAREVQKVNTFALEAFWGGDFGCLGYMLEEKPYFYQQVLRKHTLQTAFSLADLTELPRVDVLYFTVDADPDGIAYAATNAKGLILAGAGNGNYSQAWISQVAALEEKGIPVVRCSRVSCGEVVWEDVFDRFGHVIRGGSLSPQKAKILLRLALAKSWGIAEIQRAFLEY